MYHLSSSSLRNLFTTGDPISALSQEFFEGPKSNTNPLDTEEGGGGGGDPEEHDDDDEAEEASIDEPDSETELGSSFGLLSVSLLALVSGFVEQQGKKDGNFLAREEFEDTGVSVLGLVEDTHDGIKVFGFVKHRKLETPGRALRGFNDGSAIDDVDDDAAAASMAVE